MSDLLLELFSEEIPARMQVRAAADLERAVNKALLGAGFMPEGIKAFATPRRLTLVATGLPVRQPDRSEEKKGPRVGAPEKALAGFLKSAGLSSVEECEQREDKKGAFYVAVVEQKGKDTSAFIAEMVPEIVRGFAWPKAMRWGDNDLRWVRPLHSVLCAFNAEIVEFDIGGIKSGDKTAGHRFMAPDEIQTRNFEDYDARLRAAKVVLDTEERKEIIARDAATLCKAQGLELVEDTALLNEVAGLAEWPVAMMGSYDEKFLALPDEVLTASMRGHQKYFSVRDPKTGGLANRFICVANIEAPDGGAAMREGYERVLEARLSDGWFLYRQDLKIKLEDHAKNLDRVTFFEGLRSVGDKAKRVEALAREIAPAVGADPELAARAARLAKADLVSKMVNEFPELQGVMGRYYAIEEGESEVVADAIRDHYKPAGQDDEVPTAPVSVAVALAEKIDTLTAFWAIDKKPTGSSDPFALRRAALGVIQIILQSKIRYELFPNFLRQIFEVYLNSEVGQFERIHVAFEGIDFSADYETVQRALSSQIASEIDWLYPENLPKDFGAVVAEAFNLLSFFHDRLKVYLKDKKHRHDAIDAVRMDVEGNLEDDLVLIVSKLTALETFLKTDDGANLAAAYKRAANILKAEGKKGDLPDGSNVSEAHLVELSEKAFFTALVAAEAKVEKAVKAEDFETAMTALASLRAPVDQFFEAVKVNDDNADIRANRLGLLVRFRAATARVADFSKLEG